MNIQNISSLPPYLNKFMKDNYDKLIEIYTEHKENIGDGVNENIDSNIKLSIDYYDPNDAPEYDMGDLNFDGLINVIDVVSMVNGILQGTFTEEQFSVADLNGDGLINVIDIVSLVNIILS